MPRHNRRPPRNRRTHYWQKHHLARQPRPDPPEQTEILVSVTVERKKTSSGYCVTRLRVL